MKLKRLIIDNFRCFKHFDIKFAPDVSIIIGKNGAGKTSLISAIVYSLYFIFTNDRSAGNDFLSAGNPDLKMKSPSHSEFYRNKNADKIENVNLHGEMELDKQMLYWDMYRPATPGSALYPSKYKEAYQLFIQHFRASGHLPLLAYFSDSFPHRKTNLSSFAKEELGKGEQTLRNFGYYQWDNELACTTIWKLRLTNALIKDKMLEGRNTFNHAEVQYIEQKLCNFSHPLNPDCDNYYEIEKLFVAFNSKEERELWLRLKNGKEMDFDSLPAGYRRLYSIVLDLAYRAFLLNRNNSDVIEGLVLIDEIDLHLHPTLEKEVVMRFTNLFPRIQFIMTSHSPIVVSNLPHQDGDNRILRIVEGEDSPHPLPDIYGIDYDTTLRDVMETGERDSNIEFLKSSILRAMRLKDTELLKLRKEELRQCVSEKRFDEIMANVECAYKTY